MTKPLFTLLLAFLLVGSFGAASADAGWPTHPGQRLRPITQATSPAAAPYAGRPNYAHHAPVYHWGWFGAETQAPTVRQHRGYYGDTIKWSRYRWQ